MFRAKLAVILAGLRPQTQCCRAKQGGTEKFRRAPNSGATSTRARSPIPTGAEQDSRR